MLNENPMGACLPASDLERARAFYADKLGLKPSEEMGDSIMFDTGGTQFLVYASEFAGTNQATAAAWMVPDVARTVGDLQSRGVVFEEYDFPGLKTVDGIATMDDGSGRAAWFKDSEGNILGVFERA